MAESSLVQDAGADLVPSCPHHLSEKTEPLLQISDMQFKWKSTDSQTKAAQVQISTFTLSRDERVFIHGPSGCGKSTLLSLCAGILEPNSGSIHLLGQNINTLKKAQRDQFRVDHLGIIFQQFNLIPYLDLISNVMLPCQFSPRRLQAACATTGSNQISAAIATEAAKHLLEQLGIAPSHWNKPAGNLSIGQQQRVAAARALIGNPQLIIADEPTSALDEAHQRDFMECLITQCHSSSAGLIFVSHDLRLTSFFDRQVNFLEWQTKV